MPSIYRHLLLHSLFSQQLKYLAEMKGNGSGKYEGKGGMGNLFALNGMKLKITF